LASAQRTAEQQSSFRYGWEESYKQYKEDAEDAAKQGKQYFDTFSSGVEDAFVKFAQTGKLSFKDLANSIIADFARIQAKRLVVGALGGSGGGGFLGSLLPSVFGNQFTPGSNSFVGPMQPSSGGGFFGNLFGGLFGGGRSAGGAVNQNTPYMVGERGPEMFVPGNAGNIIPNTALGGGEVMQNLTTVNYTIQAVDASSFRALVARDPQFIYSVTEKGRRSQPTRSR
jgi:lambda family phage tail tape measure protein